MFELWFLKNQPLNIRQCNTVHVRGNKVLFNHGPFLMPFPKPMKIFCWIGRWFTYKAHLLMLWFELRTFEVTGDQSTTWARSDDYFVPVPHCGELKLGFFLSENHLEVEVVTARDLPTLSTGKPGSVRLNSPKACTEAIFLSCCLLISTYCCLFWSQDQPKLVIQDAFLD